MLPNKSLFFCIMIFFVGGCSKKHQQDSMVCAEIIKNKNVVVEAKQNDLAVPAGYKLKRYSESKGKNKSQLFVYDGNQNINQIDNFYKKALELEGWTYFDMSTKKERLLVANKSLKKCVVSIRPIKKNSSTIYLFVSKYNNDNKNCVELDKINKAI